MYPQSIYNSSRDQQGLVNQRNDNSFQRQNPGSHRMGASQSAPRNLPLANEIAYYTAPGNPVYAQTDYGAGWGGYERASPWQGQSLALGYNQVQADHNHLPNNSTDEITAELANEFSAEFHAATQQVPWFDGWTPDPNSPYEPSQGNGSPANGTGAHYVIQDTPAWLDHINSLTLLPGPYPCPWDGCKSRTEFRRIIDLRRHGDTIHISPSKYPCPVGDCNMAFGRRDHLRDHQRRRDHFVED
ncbi:hypothetical protein BJX99DRAFT_252846 [Aspergillus californicus]